MSAATRWTASDGFDLAYHVIGEGAPVVLLHGLFSNAETNWIKFGHADRIAAAGHRVIMPDLRAHGSSEAPVDPAAYPDGILGRDLEELVGHLGLMPGTYDLGGFSLGARTVVQGIGEGLRPRRAMLCGMGLEGLTGWAGRQAFFMGAIDRYDLAKRGDPDFMAIAFMKTMGIEREAARLLLPSFTDAKESWLDAFTMPTAVICGKDDRDNGDPQLLAKRLPDARAIAIPGTHMSSVTKSELGEAIVSFLDA
ncbi:alpha/beta fold hydrolase [Sphingomicrobium sp. XHP0235]|uniref:alpha/beta fold hydrolase n=1 Tax=Sphingomicrobium aquimarinum TaxID=3133971 RepID=UPI0031FF3B36